MPSPRTNTRRFAPTKPPSVEPGSVEGPAFATGFFARAATPMMLIDSSRRVRRANRAALRMLGLSARALFGLALDELTTPQQAQTVETNWQTILSSGQGRMLLRHRQGRIVETSYSATADIVASLHLLVFVPATDVAIYEAAPTLSRRERQVLSAIANGADSKQLAQSLLIAPETVRRHVANARRKLGAASRAHAIAIALAQGEISGPAPGGDRGRPISHQAGPAG